MTRVTHLVTLVELDGHSPDPRTVHVRARHEAVLDDGRHVVLLDDRGWGATVSGGSNVWSRPTLEDMHEAARAVVGPDEPAGGRTWADAERAHWESMAAILRRHGVGATAADLAGLRHDVDLSDDVLRRIGR